MPSQAPITQLISEAEPLLSVEFFPPKTEEAVADLQQAALEINALEPDFVSVTYGAGGTTRSRSAKVSQVMKDEVGLNVMPHLTCVGATREELGEIVDEFYSDGYRNIMTLRGDPPKGQESFVATEGGFSYASDLVSFIKDRHPDFCLGVAGYPEKHPEAADLEKDLDNLKIKVDAGASFITTQLFFDNAAFYTFVEKARGRGIDIPIFPGLMPVVSFKQIQRILQMCGSQLPKALEDKLVPVQDDIQAVQQIGADWAKEQLADLLSNKVPGIHLYALNKADVALDLMKAFRTAAP
ncbi:MAG: methylenetetrahydrofolate reductase [NAD(P)H] [Verrucomicrobiota bacterium]